MRGVVGGRIFPVPAVKVIRGTGRIVNGRHFLVLGLRIAFNGTRRVFGEFLIAVGNVLGGSVDVVFHALDVIFKLLDFRLQAVGFTLNGLGEVVCGAFGFFLNLFEFSQFGLALNITFDLRHHALRLADPLAGGARHDGQFFRAEHDKRHSADHDKL